MSNQEPEKPKNKPSGGGWIYTAVLLLLASMLIMWYMKGYIKAAKIEAAQKAVAYAAAHPPAPIAVPKFPTSGEGFATRYKPLRVYLDPKKVHARGLVPTHYVFEDHPTMTFDDYFDGREDSKWWTYPAGWYLVSPIKENEVYFRWWQ